MERSVLGIFLLLKSRTPIQVKRRPDGRTFVRRCPRTKVRERLTFTSYSYFCTMLKMFFVQTVVHSTLLVSCTKISVRVITVVHEAILPRTFVHVRPSQPLFYILIFSIKH